jgi:hypothetical protein
MSETNSLPKIFVFVNSHSHQWYNALALSEDGVAVAGHACSTPWFVWHDMIGSGWKTENYEKHYPNGYEIVNLIDDSINGSVANHAAFQAAVEKSMTLLTNKQDAA